ncbi:MAG: hypothetical protein DCF18_04725 [Cyanobium sp.]|nr:hypothetical protein [Synechococcus sp. CS-1333]PZV23945.1 MAG: hypothetical protein DCF18_04725 [Cyanobium sp.]
MGEFVASGGVSAGLQSGLGLVSALISVIALGLFALFQDENQNNDDDDSNPGGGLMQPVA